MINKIKERLYRKGDKMVKSGNGKLSYRALQEYSRMRNTLFISTKILLTLNTKVMLI